ncbi:MAG: hypothetical protein ACT4NX_00165 [Deltaproteobacteria bacterium]
MNRALTFIFFAALSLTLLTIQSTILSPRNLGFLSPDLNLLLVIFFSLYSGIKWGGAMALGNSYMMDALSGHITGAHLLSRMSAFILIQSLSGQFFRMRGIQAAAIVFGTLFSWIFFWAIASMRTDFDFPMSAADIALQAVVNAVVGVPLFFLIEWTNAKLQR